jgi:hypothetical protein
MAAIDNGDQYSQTATHATSAVATQTGVVGKRSYITAVSASSDKAGAIILVKQGSTTIWQDIVGAGNYGRTFNPPLRGAADADVSVTIDGTAACKSNILGFTL